MHQVFNAQGSPVKLIEYMGGKITQKVGVAAERVVVYDEAFARIVKFSFGFNSPFHEHGNNFRWVSIISNGQ